MAINQSEQLAPVREMRISVEQHGEVDARAAGKAQITAPAQRLAIGARQCEAGVSDGRSRSARTWPQCGGLDGYIEQRTRARRGSAAALRRKDIFCRREQCRACQWHEPPVRPPYLSPPTQPA